MTEKTYYQCLKEMREVQGRDGTWDFSPYMMGMYNGLELATALFENRPPILKEAPTQWLEQMPVEGKDE